MVQLWPIFSDLEAVATALEKRKGFERVSRILKQALFHKSCVSDIAQVLGCAEALQALREGSFQIDNALRPSVEGSLLMSAVILYARATAGTSKKGGRGSSQISAGLTNEQRSDHDFLLQVRSRAMAHVHSRDRMGHLVWHDELLFALELAEGYWAPGAATRSIQFDVTTLKIILRQAGVARSILNERFQVSLAAAAKLLNDLPERDALLRKHTFDPVGKFGSEEAVAAVLRGLPKGGVTIVTQG